MYPNRGGEVSCVDSVMAIRDETMDIDYDGMELIEDYFAQVLTHWYLGSFDMMIDSLDGGVVRQTWN